MLKRPSLQESESAVEPIESGQIDAGDVVEQIRSEDERAGGGRNVGLLVDDAE